MKNRKLTISILIAVTVALIGWDIYVYYTPEDHDTISRVMLDFAMRHPVCPFAFGVLCGHLFWPQSDKK